MTMDYTDKSPLAIYLFRLAPTTQRTAKSTLDRIAKFMSAGLCSAETFNWANWTKADSLQCQQGLKEFYSPKTINYMLSVVRSLLHEYWRSEAITIERYHRAIDFHSLRFEEVKPGRKLSSSEIKALFDLCRKDDRPIGKRDAAIFALLYGCGLRRTELINLDLSDIDFADFSLVVQNGKGMKARIVYFNKSVAIAVKGWLAIRGLIAGPVFVRIGKGDRITASRLTDQAIMVILAARGKTLGLKHFTPHDIRRTFVSDLLDSGVDPFTIKDLAGHDYLRTTAIYDHRSQEHLREAADKINIFPVD